METAALNKRIFVYVLDFLISLGLGFATAIPFLQIPSLYLVFYFLIAFGFSIIINFLIKFLILVLTRGYTISSVIFGVKYVSGNGGVINRKQCFMRAYTESIFIFAFIDLIYFIKNRTERGAIDRLSDSFAIDIRQ